MRKGHGEVAVTPEKQELELQGNVATALVARFEDSDEEPQRKQASRAFEGIAMGSADELPLIAPAINLSPTPSACVRKLRFLSASPPNENFHWARADYPRVRKGPSSPRPDLAPD